MSGTTRQSIAGYYTSGGSLPRQVTGTPAGDGTVLIDGREARVGTEFFRTEGEAVVVALRANGADDQRLRDQLDAGPNPADEAELRGRLVEVNERIITLRRRGAELEQLAQAAQDREDRTTEDRAPSR